MKRWMWACVIVAALVAPALVGRPLAATQGRAAAPADQTEWTIDPAHSAANFAVRHMLVSTVRGKLGQVTGKVWYDGKTSASIRIDVKIDVKGLSTGNDARDAHLRTPDFFAADQFPAITFKSKRVVPGAAGTFKLIGDLTIRDVTKEVTFEVEGPAPPVTDRGVQRSAATATTTLNRFDYGLKWNNLIEAGGAVVGSDVKVTVDLEVTRR